MSPFSIPTRDQVGTSTQAVFDSLTGAIGFVPNLFAVFAHSPTALPAYFGLSTRSSSLRAREREAINLAVSEANGCRYCLAAHSAVARGLNFSEAEVLQLRAGAAPFDTRLDTLVRFARAVTERRGRLTPDEVHAFVVAGLTVQNLVDAVVTVGEKTIANYLYEITQVPIDFPPAPELEVARSAEAAPSIEQLEAA